MKMLNKTSVALRLLVAISLVAIAGCSAPTSRIVDMWAYGDVYDGQWESSVTQGQGRYTQATNGSVFVGEFRNSEKPPYAGKHYGSIVWEEDGSKYVGELNHRRPHGYGVYTKPDGYKYEGDFHYGKKTGTATITYPVGRQFVGSVIDGVPGEGKYTGPWPEGVSEVLDAQRLVKKTPRGMRFFWL